MSSSESALQAREPRQVRAERRCRCRRDGCARASRACRAATLPRAPCGGDPSPRVFGCFGHQVSQIDQVAKLAPGQLAQPLGVLAQGRAAPRAGSASRTSGTSIVRPKGNRPPTARQKVRRDDAARAGVSPIRSSRIASGVARVLREVWWRSSREAGCEKPGSTPTNSNTRRRVSMRLVAELLLLDHEDLLAAGRRAGTAAAGCSSGCGPGRTCSDACRVARRSPFSRRLA